MLKNYLQPQINIIFFCVLFLFSCQKSFDDSNYIAYFGGEIINPQSNEILFMKDGKVIDTIFLDKKNRFLHKFDSLAPGLYTFQHAPEYQYIYFDKNDSLMIRLNSLDFDNSLAFCGRGDQKNNFLIDQFLKNQSDFSSLYVLLEKDYKQYNKSIDSIYNIRQSEYLKRKTEIKWSDNFDVFAKASVDFNYYHKKELYPVVHHFKTNNKVYDSLPSNYYDFRKNINFNNNEFANFSPFIKYITSMLNNISYVRNKHNFDELSLENNIYKLNATDSIISNQHIKNMVLNNIAFMYLLEDQNMYNNKKFIDRYLELSTDKEQQLAVKNIYDAVQNLKVGNKLPNVSLINENFSAFPLNKITNNKVTVIFFWTTNANSHLVAVHKKIKKYKDEFPNVNFVGINVNDSKENWLKSIQVNDLHSNTELYSSDFQEIRKKWVITKIHRTIILNEDGSIKNAFANVFDANFANQLK